MTDNVQTPEAEPEDARNPVASGEDAGGGLRPPAADAEDERAKNPGPGPDEAGEAPELQDAAAGTLARVNKASKTLALALAQWEACNAEVSKLRKKVAAVLKRGQKLSDAAEQMNRQAAALDRQQSIIMSRLTAALTGDDSGEKRGQIAEDFRKAMRTGYWPGVIEVVRETVEQTHAEIKTMVLRDVVWTRRFMYAGGVALGLWGMAILVLAIRGGWMLAG